MQLLEHNLSKYPITDIQYPFTPYLSIQIASKATLHFEGTDALFLGKSSQSKRIFLLTAHHVALPQPAHSKQLYSHKNPSQCRVDIVILSSKAYTNTLEGMMVEIGCELIFVRMHQRELDNLGEAIEGRKARRTRVQEDYQASARQKMLDVNDFHGDITNHWSTLSQCMLGYVFHAPPISLTASPKQLTED